MSDGDNKPTDFGLPPVETRETKRALQLKSEIFGLLQDVVDALEQARAEGFEIQFQVQRDPVTMENTITPANVKVIKSW